MHIRQQVEAGQINALVDVAQLASALESAGSAQNDGGSSRDGGGDVEPQLDSATAAGIRDLFSSAATLVLSLAAARAPKSAQQQQQAPPDGRPALDWAALDRLAMALNGSHSRC